MVRLVKDMLSDIFLAKAKRYHYKKHNYDVAKFYYLKAIKYNSNSIEAAVCLAKLLRFRYRDFVAAIVYYNRAIELDPDNYLWYYKKGFCNGVLKNYQEQIEDYSKAIELSPSVDCYRSRMLAHKEVNDLENIIKDGTKAIELGDRNSTTFKAVGDSYLALAKEYREIEEEGYGEEDYEENDWKVNKSIMNWEEKIKQNQKMKNIRFKMLDNNMSKRVTDKHQLIDLVSFEKYIEIEEGRIPIILGTQFGLYPNLDDIKGLFNGDKLVAILNKSLLSGHISGLSLFKVVAEEYSFLNKEKHMFFSN